MTTRVLLIRHGETDWNAEGRWQGHAPVPLNEAGLQQSAALGRYLAQNGYTLDAIYSSDLPRAAQTAAAVAQALGLMVQTDARFRESDLGEWQGMTRAEVQAWDGERFAAFEADWFHNTRPGGESMQQVQQRMRAGFDEVSARHPDQTVAIVTHGGALGMLLRSLFGPIERPSLTNTSLTIVERESGQSDWQPVKLVWTPHLVQGGALGETW